MRLTTHDDDKRSIRVLVTRNLVSEPITLPSHTPIPSALVVTHDVGESKSIHRVGQKTAGSYEL
jgi:hypothetical protein